MSRLDPRQPLVIDTTELGRRPGTMLTVQRTVGAPDDLGTDVIGVAQGQPIELDVRLESVVEGVLVTGSAHTTAAGACVRCLDPVDREVDATFQELFVYADRAAHREEVGDDEDEVRELEGDLLDLEPVLRDAVVPTLPFQPVCREDCPGLCSECGARLADDPDHHHEVLDPRWSALSGLSSNPGGGASDRSGPDEQPDEKRN
ncbi:MAG TPA: DUF177 domain-containing protein [Segeticoccus sp.]|jgi:uncharacterized protein|nr:DUF177 domain-containing protein [Segeticoccus sp.]